MRYTPVALSDNTRSGMPHIEHVSACVGKHLQSLIDDEHRAAIALVFWVSFAHVSHHRQKTLDVQHVDQFHPFANLHRRQVLHQPGLGQVACPTL